MSKMMEVVQPKCFSSHFVQHSMNGCEWKMKRGNGRKLMVYWTWALDVIKIDIGEKEKYRMTIKG